MIDILKGADTAQRGLPSPPTRRGATEQLRYDLDKVIQYRRGLERRVDSDHLLLRLLETLNVSVDQTDQDYVWEVSDNALRIANTFQMTSMWGHGRPFSPGVFFGPTVKEVLIANIDDFSVKEASKGWEDLRPIRPIAHPYNDLSLPTLDGNGEGLNEVTGWAVVTINIPMLALQYKRWVETFVKGVQDPPPNTLFLGRYPLANMLYGHLDLCMYNRLMAFDFEEATQTLKNTNPFYLNFQQGGQTDRMIQYAVDFMQRAGYSFDDWLDCVPQVTATNVHEWLALPDVTFTTQVEWAIFLARLPTMVWLLRHNVKVASNRNNDYIIAIRHWVQRMRNGRFFHQGLQGALLRDVESIVDNDLMPYL
jgi:hypothetical protein